MAIFKYTKSKLLFILKDVCEKNNKTFCVCDIYTAGKVSEELSHLKCCVGNTPLNTSGDIKTFLSLEIKNHTNKTESLKKAREHFGADFSLFISELNVDTNTVKILAQSNIRTYCVNIKIDDEDTSSESISHKAIYELTKLAYNEIYQSIPVKERKFIF